MSLGFDSYRYAISNKQQPLAMNRFPLQKVLLFQDHISKDDK